MLIEQRTVREKLQKKTYEVLASLNAGSGEKIPRLVEIMDLVFGKAKINIEFKNPRCAKILAQFLKKQITEKQWQVDDIYVSSFSWKALRLFHREAPMFKIGVLINKYPLFVRTAVATNAYSINIPLFLAWKFFVRFIQLMGWKVFVYTVDEPKDIARMKRIGVDGIFSNFPDRI